jgi:sialic acid synthase SpsE
MVDYINNNNGFIVNSHKTPVVIDQRTLSKDFDIYNANEFWYKINLYDLIEKMKTVYQMHKENRKKLEEKRAVGLSSTEQFSYTTIGKKLCI